jgi:hypothetical protein
MFGKIKELWEDKGFEIVFGLCLSFIIIYGLYRIITKQSGSYSKSYYYNNNEIENNFIPKKNIPKESKGEAECRRVLRKFFNRSFNKARPDFLNNPVTGGQYNLELDCYDPELRLAVEYNGIQHYQYNKFFHRNNDHFLTQKYRDDMKRRICKEHGVTLIEVPYTVKLENIERFLLNELHNKGYDKYMFL